MFINFNETYDFGGELQVLQQYMQKQEFKTFGTSLKSFPFIYGFFPKGQNSQHGGHDVRPCYKSLGLVILFLGKEKRL
jgi:hypothetical protein